MPEYTTTDPFGTTQTLNYTLGNQTPNPEPAPAPWDYWTTLASILGEDFDAPRFQSALTSGGVRWRIPKKAQQMLGFASSLAGLGDEGEELARQMALQSIVQGYQQPSWSLADLFAPAFQNLFTQRRY